MRLHSRPQINLKNSNSGTSAAVGKQYVRADLWMASLLCVLFKQSWIEAELILGLFNAMYTQTRKACGLLCEWGDRWARESESKKETANNSGNRCAWCNDAGGVMEGHSPVCVLEVDIHFLCRTKELWKTRKAEHEWASAAISGAGNFTTKQKMLPRRQFLRETLGMKDCQPTF